MLSLYFSLSLINSVSPVSFISSGSCVQVLCHRTLCCAKHSVLSEEEPGHVAKIAAVARRRILREKRANTNAKGKPDVKCQMSYTFDRNVRYVRCQNQRARIPCLLIDTSSAVLLPRSLSCVSPAFHDVRFYSVVLSLSCLGSSLWRLFCTVLVSVVLSFCLLSAICFLRHLVSVALLSSSAFTSQQLSCLSARDVGLGDGSCILSASPLQAA